jgi:hypothetical protein
MVLKQNECIANILEEIDNVSDTIKTPFVYVLSELLPVRAPHGMGTCQFHVDLNGTRWESFESFADSFEDDTPDADIAYSWERLDVQDFYEIEIKKNVFFTKAALANHVAQYRHLYEGKLSWSLLHCLKNEEMGTVFDIFESMGFRTPSPT